jgi:hypothetical protein|tara:strand:+ start:1636 stop:2241 length:606 start_codon:yes stop_codon:yes gene_type:complete
MIKQVDKNIVQLDGFDLFVHLQEKNNWSDKRTFEFMKKHNQDVSFYAEFERVKKEHLRKEQFKRQSIINGYSHDDPQVIAVSKSADVTPVEAIDLLIDEDWICLTDEEADERAEEYILESLWAFNPSFLSAHSDIDESVFELLQEKCEDANEAIFTMIKDVTGFIYDAISADGRGHFISHYDGEEHEHKINNEWYYCYKMN